MFPVQNGLICWLDAMDGKAGDTLLKDRTSYGHNLIVENFQQEYGFTGTSIKVKQSKIGTSNNNALYIANGGFKTPCKSFCICIERHNTNQPWYIFDGRGLNGQGSSTNHCFSGNTGSSYDNSKTRRDGVLTYNNSNLDINKKTFLYFELKEAELFTLSILMRYSKNENTEGEFYSLYAYNRALTEEEILQNMEYENNKISYVNENNLPKIVDKLSNASNIKITGNKYGNRVQTVVDKIVEKADDVTKAIEQEVVNNSYSFKVGTGDVDVSTDVEDGFGEVGIKGVTYQNILGTRITTSNGVEKSNNIITFNKVAQTNCAVSFLDSLAQVDKTYTLIFDILENTIENPTNGNIGKINIVSYNSGNYFIKYKETGHIKVLLKQPATSTGKPYVEFYNSTSGKFVMTAPILLEGNHLDNPSIPSKISNIVGVGDKSKNLFNYKLHDSIEYNGNYYVTAKERWKSNTVEYTVEPNTDYTISVDRCEGDLWLGFDVDGVQFNNNNHSKFSKVIRTNETGKLLLRVGANNSADVGHKFINLQLEKGTVATTYEPYHDGHKIEILSNTRSVSNEDFLNHVASFGINNIKCEKYLGKLRFTAMGGYYESNFANKRTLRLIPNTKYTLKMIIDVDTPSTYIIAGALNKTKITNNHYEFTTDSTGMVAIYPFSTGTSFVNVPFDIVIEPSDNFPNDLNYKEDKTQILLDEPLMRLPNGVCDEITRDGKLIRRVGKLNFLDFESKYKIIPSQIVWGANNSHGAYQWNGVSSNTNITGGTSNPINYKYSGNATTPNILCDKYPYSNGFHGGNGSGGVGLPDRFFAISNDGIARLMIAKKLVNSTEPSAVTSSMLKNWVEENCDLNAIFYYELAEPIITELPAPYLRMFKEGHLTFNTLVAPESNHMVQLNKSAQIERSIREVQGLDNRINVLENNYDNLMLSTISRLNDLELDYTLK